LIREPSLPGAAAGPIGQWEAKVLASIPTTRFDTVPGARFSYSNIGFAVLGLAISRAAKAPYIDLVTDGIFKPLGMRSSTFIIDDRLRPKLAVGYSELAPGLPDREHDGRGYKVPNGGIYTTVGDLTHYIAMFEGLRGDSVLSAKSRAEMMRVQTPEDPRSGYGFGLFVETTAGGHRMINHGGGVAGYTTYFIFDPDAQIGVILLRNYERGQTDLAEAAHKVLADLVAASR
jgi:CubicO group peptidase (beta-lactamase class C family)